MTRRLCGVSAFVALVLTVLSPLPVSAIDEPDRLWLVGERAFADGLYPVARRALERFVAQAPGDPRRPDALLMLGKSRLTLGEVEPALETFRRAGATETRPAKSLEIRFWEGEALFRLRRFAEARAAYDDVLRKDKTAPFAPDALYGYGWAELELRRPEPAIAAFRDFLKTWGDHELAPSATFRMAQALSDLKRYREAVTALDDFATKYPQHTLVEEAEYLHASARLKSGDTKGGLAELRAFADAHPSHPLAVEARKSLHQTLAKSGSPAQLDQEYSALMSRAPATPDALAEALSIAQRRGKVKDQEAAWRKLRTDFPDHPVTQRIAFDLANDAFKRSQWKDAAAYASVAAGSTDDATRAEAWLLVGESELKLKRLPQAAKAFEHVVAAGNTDPAVRYRALAGLGLAREQQGDLRGALAAYESVAAKSPDNALRQWARERMSAVKNRPATPPATKPKGTS